MKQNEEGGEVYLMGGQGLGMAIWCYRRHVFVFFNLEALKKT